MAKVSVVIPTYNREKVIARAVQSVLGQTFRDVQLIVVDDASGDATETVLASLADDRLRCVKNSRNLGPSGARNRGIAEAEGEYVAFLDSDDEWAAEKVEKQVAAMESAGEGVGVVYTDFEQVDHRRKEQLIKHEGDIADDIFTGNFVGTVSTVMVRKKLFDEVGFFDERMRVAEDWEMWIRLSVRCRFAYIHEALVRYHYQGDSISRDSEKIIEGYATLLQKHRRRILGLPRGTRAELYLYLGKNLLRKGNVLSGGRFLLKTIRSDWRMTADVLQYIFLRKKRRSSGFG